MSFSTFLQQSIDQNYGLKVLAAIPIGTGTMSNTMQLVTDKGNLFLKCYKHSVNITQPSNQHLPVIAFGHAAQRFLRRNDIPVPRLLKNRTGETYTSANTEIYLVSEFAEGCDYEAVEPDLALKSAADLLGHFHHQLRSFQSPIKCQWKSMEGQILTGLTTSLERMCSVIVKDKTHPVTQKRMHQWKEAVIELAGALPTKEESKWIIHGDYRAQNLRFDRDGHVSAILDLDTIRPANRLFDLAYALVFFAAVYQNKPLTPHQKSVFLSTYETVCPLSTTERRLLTSHLKLAFFRGMTLWLNLHDFGGMRDKTRPWIKAYLDNEDTIAEF